MVWLNRQSSISIKSALFGGSLSQKTIRDEIRDGNKVQFPSMEHRIIEATAAAATKPMESQKKKAQIIEE